MCGLAIAVKNARAEVKAEARWITPHGGGDVPRACGRVHPEGAR